MTELDKVRLGGRNYLRPGDVVKVTPSKPGKRDGFEGRVLRIRQAGDVEVDVVGGPGGRGGVRTFKLERLRRVAQTRRRNAS